MIPDRSIVKKIKEYDPHLYIEWNNNKEYFELWREMAHGRKLITPVTRSVYFEGAPKEYVQLDERLVWWVWAADSWKTSPKQHALESDRRWKEFNKEMMRKQRAKFRDMGKDTYGSLTNFFTTKHAARNDPHKAIAARASTQNAWTRPDLQSKTSSRVFHRSNASAKKLGFQR